VSKSERFSNEISGTIHDGIREMRKQILIFRRFAHRRNADASLDSICLACFVTVGSAPLGFELQDFENNHRCALWKPGRLPLSTHEGTPVRSTASQR
jgi:hypothetical protein